MGLRADLQSDLQSVIGSANKVYYQPPETVKMTYPCIVYSLSGKALKYADDKTYKNKNRYEITVISRNPDNNIADLLLNAFKYSSFDRRFVSDNLYHDVLTIFY